MDLKPAVLWTCIIGLMVLVFYSVAQIIPETTETPQAVSTVTVPQADGKSVVVQVPQQQQSKDEWGMLDYVGAYSLFNWATGGSNRSAQTREVHHYHEAPVARAPYVAPEPPPTRNETRKQSADWFNWSSSSSRPTQSTSSSSTRSSSSPSWGTGSSSRYSGGSSSSRSSSSSSSSRYSGGSSSRSYGSGSSSRYSGGGRR